LDGPDNAAYMASVMIYLQDSAIDRAEFYRGDAAWMGLFDTQKNLFKTAYAYKATAAMLDTPERLDVTGSDTFGFAALAGRSADGKTVQVLISNYPLAQDYKPHMMIPPPDVQALLKIDFSKLKVLPKRTDIPAVKNLGYDLTIDHLPWGNAAFTIKRYRITGTEDFKLAGKSSGKDGQAELSNSLPAPGVELIILQRR